MNAKNKKAQVRRRQAGAKARKTRDRNAKNAPNARQSRSANQVHRMMEERRELQRQREMQALPPEVREFAQALQGGPEERGRT